jgi:hypothetical protein
MGDEYERPLQQVGGVHQAGFHASGRGIQGSLLSLLVQVVRIADFIKRRGE